MPKLSQSSAFTLCDDGSCDDPKQGSAPENIECKKTDKCAGSGCYCQLFHRDKDAAADDPWDVTPVDGANEAKKKAGHSYSCFCVKPVLPTGYTICDKPLCKLTDTADVGTSGTVNSVECTGDCADPCKCTLFRLHVKPKNPAKKAAAKWEFVAKAGTKVEREGGYYYRCFCAK